jgi:hypothetical protein
MPSYKTPEWIARARRNWLKGQACGQCGHRGRAGLVVIKYGDAPPLKWTLKGPSHRLFNVVCRDVGDCSRRRTELGVAKPAAVVAHVCKRGICRPPRQRIAKSPPRTLERHEVPAEIERSRATVAKIEAGLARPDKRPVCPDHGPKNTMLYGGAVRFTCCGRVVPGAKLKGKARRVV